MPSQLQGRVRELEIETDRLKKQLLVSSRDQWAIAMTKLQAAYSELELGYTALAVECILKRSQQKRIAQGVAPDMVDLP